MTDTTIQRPSGLTTGGPTRVMSHTSSCVGIRLSAANAPPAISQPANNSGSRYSSGRSLLWSFMVHTVTLRAVKRLVKRLLVAGGVLLVAILVLAVDVARFGGTFRQVDNRFAGSCS